VSTILQRVIELSLSGILPLAFLNTLMRVLQGYGYAVLFGAGLGIIMGYFPLVSRALSAPIELVRPLPTAALIPVFMLFLGLGDRMKIFIIAWGSFFPILLNAIHGVHSIEPTLIETARTFRFGKGQTLGKFILPGASAQIMVGMRLAVPIALILGVTTELIAGENGIGFFILGAERTFHAADMYAGVFTLGLVGYALNWTFRRLESLVLPWHISQR
jgi:ABC-type nitrate/sulfonate/bicarbonate transport system permease component